MPSSYFYRLLILAAAFFIGFVEASYSAEKSPPTKKRKNVRTGQVQYQVLENDKKIPEQFRVAAHAINYRQEIVSFPGDTVQVSRVTFPSPIKTPHAKNNTVHCEYFLPTKVAKGKPVPGVIVLHILGGDFALSRLFCSTLASRGVAALFVKMPYYGPRRQPGVSVRMIHRDPRITVKGMTQAVQDIRCAATWLGTQKEIDEKQLGIFGISLGGITASLVATLDPRFQKVCPMLAGGGMGEVVWKSKQLRKYKGYWKENGFTKQRIENILKVVDPVTYATSVPGRQVLMLNALNDKVIPRNCTVALWKAFGKPKIVWYKSGHYTAITYIFEGLKSVSDFFQPVAISTKVKG